MFCTHVRVRIIKRHLTFEQYRHFLQKANCTGDPFFDNTLYFWFFGYSNLSLRSFVVIGVVSSPAASVPVLRAARRSPTAWCRPLRLRPGPRPRPRHAGSSAPRCLCCRIPPLPPSNPPPRSRDAVTVLPRNLLQSCWAMAFPEPSPGQCRSPP